MTDLISQCKTDRVSLSTSANETYTAQFKSLLLTLNALSYTNLLAAKFNQISPSREDFDQFYTNDRRLEEAYKTVIDQVVSLKEQLAV